MRIARRAAIAAAFALPFAASAAFAADKTVTLGYQTSALPYIVGIQDGGLARATGWHIDFRRFNSGAEIFAAIAGGAVQGGDVGSSPFAAAVSNGIDVQAVYVLAGAGEDEQLIVRNGSGINSPADLRGKHLAAAPVSTDHYMLLSVLKQEGIPENAVTFLTIPQPQIVAGWARGDIDAAFVWNPALDELLKTGKSLLTAEQVAARGAPTFDALVFTTAFIHDNPDFVRSYVHAVNGYYADYASHPDDWNAGSDNTKKLAALLGATPAQHADDLKSHHFPTATEQLSATWLGGGIATALKNTAAFLKEQHKITTIADSYAGASAPEYLASSVHAAN